MRLDQCGDFVTVTGKLFVPGTSSASTSMVGKKASESGKSPRIPWHGIAENRDLQEIRTKTREKGKHRAEKAIELWAVLTGDWAVHIKSTIEKNWKQKVILYGTAQSVTAPLKAMGFQKDADSGGFCWTIRPKWLV